MKAPLLRHIAISVCGLACAGAFAAGALPSAQKLPRGVTASIETIPGGYPLAVTAAYGSIWVSQHRQTVLYRISPRTNKIIATIDVGRESCGRLVAGFGKVWMPRCDEPNGFVVVDAKKNRVVRVFRNGFGLQVGVGAGSFWMPGLNGTVQRIDPKTLKPTAVLKVGGAWLTFDGASMWALGGDGVLSQIDPAKNEVVWTTTVPERYLFSYLDVYDGQLWFGSDAPAIARLDLVTKAFVPVPVKAQPNLGDRPLAIGLGSLWWRTSFTNVSRIDPKTGKVIARYPSATHGTQAVAYGALWVGNSGDSTIWRDVVKK